MPTFAGPVRSRVLTNPKDYQPFVTFCSGKTRRSEREVNTTVHHAWAGTCPEQHLVVVLEKESETDATGNPVLIGFCAISTQPLGYEGVQGLSPTDRGAYILAFGTDLDYRKCFLKGGKTSPGGALLGGSLKAIKLMFGDGSMPFVKAMILPDNHPSQGLFDEYGFECLGLGPQKEQLHVVRLPGLALGKTRRPTWSPWKP